MQIVTNPTSIPTRHLISMTYSGGGTGGTGGGCPPPNNFGEGAAPLQRIFGCTRRVATQSCCLYTAHGRCGYRCAILCRLVVMQRVHVLYLASCRVAWRTASACNITVQLYCTVLVYIIIVEKHVDMRKIIDFQFPITFLLFGVFRQMTPH